MGMTVISNQSRKNSKSSVDHRSQLVDLRRIREDQSLRRMPQRTRTLPIWFRDWWIQIEYTLVKVYLFKQIKSKSKSRILGIWVNSYHS